MNREIKYIVVHSTKTNEGTTVNDLHNEWKAKNKTPRFHCIVDKMGHAHRMLGANFITSQFLIRESENSSCYHLAYLGGLSNCPTVKNLTPGVPEDTRTPLQTHVLFEKIEEIRKLYPNAKVVAADELIRASTGRSIGSPCFNVAKWFDYHNNHRDQWVEEDFRHADELARLERHGKKDMWDTITAEEREIFPCDDAALLRRGVDPLKQYDEFFRDATGLEWNASED